MCTVHKGVCLECFSTQQYLWYIIYTVTLMSAAHRSLSTFPTPLWPRWWQWDPHPLGSPSLFCEVLFVRKVKSLDFLFVDRCYLDSASILWYYILSAKCRSLRWMTQTWKVNSQTDKACSTRNSRIKFSWNILVQSEFIAKMPLLRNIFVGLMCVSFTGRTSGLLDRWESHL